MNLLPMHGGEPQTLEGSWVRKVWVVRALNIGFRVLGVLISIGLQVRLTMASTQLRVLINPTSRYT